MCITISEKWVKVAPSLRTPPLIRWALLLFVPVIPSTLSLLKSKLCLYVLFDLKSRPWLPAKFDDNWGADQGEQGQAKQTGKHNHQNEVELLVGVVTVPASSAGRCCLRLLCCCLRLLCCCCGCCSNWNRDNCHCTFRVPWWPQISCLQKV